MCYLLSNYFLFQKAFIQLNAEQNLCSLSTQCSQQGELSADPWYEICSKASDKCLAKKPKLIICRIWPVNSGKIKSF